MIIKLTVSALCVLTFGSMVSFTRNGSGRGASLVGAGVTITAGILSLWPAAAVLWRGTSESLRLAWQIPFGTFYIAVDPLSALFILIISIVSILAAIYGIGYLEPYAGKKHLGAAWGCFNLLFASMLLVVVARNGLLFIMAWEAMSLSSFFLVMFEHEKKSVRNAGWIYLTAAHLGVACLLLLFLILAGSGADLDFDRLSVPSGSVMASVIFVLAVLGFGAKAGFLPLHVWLPEAHPAAPSHVSAVMSGVMIKTGIYGLIRIIPFLGLPALWWGWTFIAIGAVSGILGVLFALAQHDLKRLLAYSSVENIGIICLGIGLWLLGISAQKPELAALGIMGGLLHVCNHAIFKSLLFLGAGAVKQSAHTLEIDHLGGLQKKMPHTARAFLVGAAAICGLPPLNGFVSELLIYIGAFTALSSAANSFLPVAGMATLVALSIIGALAAACFTKVYGIVFLGAARSDNTVCAHEVSSSMRHPMTALAVLCLLLGLGAPLGVMLVSPAASQLLGEIVARAAIASAWPWLMLLTLLGGSVVAITGLLALLRNRLQLDRFIGREPTWDCGYIQPTARMQYTASSFSWPIIDMFRWLIRPQVETLMDSGDFPQQAHLASHTVDLFQHYLFTPLFRFIESVARFLHGLQQGRNQLYILYIAITVLALLLIKVR